MKKLNILMVTEAFYPDSIGGVQTYVYNLSKSLVRKGHNVYLITLRPNKKLLIEEILEGINIFRYDSALKGPFLFFRRPLLSIINSRRIFDKLAKKIKFDIINYHLTLPAFGISMSRKSKAIPQIYTFHSSMHQGIVVQSKKKQYVPCFFLPVIFQVVRFIEYINLKSVSKIIVLSNFNKEQLTKLYKIVPQKIELIPGGVDVDEFKPLADNSEIKKNLKLATNRVVLLTVRRLVARMGLENLIKAIDIVKKQYPLILLLIAGEGFLKENLEKLIKRMKLEDNVYLKGCLTNDELKLYYQTADLFILPTESLEGFGLVTVEALSSGLPVLATPVGGSIEILSRLDRKMIFSGIEFGEIAQGIINFINYTEDFLELGKKCRQFVLQNYSWRKVSDDVETLFYKEVYKRTKG